MTGSPTSFAFGPFLLDTRERRLLRDGEVVPLTLKAFDLLHVLVENPGHLLHKEELLRRVWPDTVVEENNLSVQIAALRKLLGAGSIVNVAGHGYRLGEAPQGSGSDSAPAAGAATAAVSDG